MQYERADIFGACIFCLHPVGCSLPLTLCWHACVVPLGPRQVRHSMRATPAVRCGTEVNLRNRGRPAAGLPGVHWGRPSHLCAGRARVSPQPPRCAQRSPRPPRQGSQVDARYMYTCMVPHVLATCMILHPSPHCAYTIAAAPPAALIALLLTAAHSTTLRQ